jgi:putative LysE/RhtB family amino acid efflux pump
MIGSVLKGAWLGLCIAAPIGPIGILVLTRALRWGRGAGLASGFGVALADLIYGLLAVAGVRLAAGHARTLAIVGGFILLWLAWRLWRQMPSGDAAPAARMSRWSCAATTFLLTMSNPMTIVLFGAMVASAGAGRPAQFVGGIFLGSMLWWTVLSFAAAWLRRWIEIRGVVLNRIAAVTLAAFGLWAIWSQA